MVKKITKTVYYHEVIIYIMYTIFNDSKLYVSEVLLVALKIWDFGEAVRARPLAQLWKKK